MLKNIVVAVALGTITAAALPAQSPVVVQQGKRTVEVMGLEKWTVRMLEDSIERVAPGQKLGDAACMATLRYTLGFRDALVRRYVGFDRNDPDKQFVSVRVIEPSRVDPWRRVSSNKFESLLPEYAALILPVTDSTGSVWPVRLMFAYQVADSARRAEMLSSADSLALIDYQRSERFLASQSSSAQRDRAIAVLDSSASPSNRMAAALVLLKHPSEERARLALTRALRDPHEGVRSIASISLQYFPAQRVDWTPLIGDLRALLAGANLEQTETVMDMLVDTGVGPSLAAPLLRGNSRWVLQLLASKAPMTAASTRRFLTALNNGADLGATPGAWAKWAQTL